jgi:hypothetical protein
MVWRGRNHMAVRQIAGLHAFVVVLLLLAATPRASAGPYGDALGKCVVESATAAEKTTFVRWFWAMLALHPDVQSLSAVTPEQLTALSKETGQMLARLVVDACGAKARKALKQEGPLAVQAGVTLLGQVAMQELFEHPKFVEGATEPLKYIDWNKLNESVAPPRQ